MTGDQSKPRRWRPRWSVRTLVIVLTLACAYLACLGPTKSRGVNDVARLISLDLGYIPPEHEKVWVRQYMDEAVLPLVVSATHPGVNRRQHYFWFFGYVVKLPHETALPKRRYGILMPLNITASE